MSAKNKQANTGSNSLNNIVIPQFKEEFCPLLYDKLYHWVERRYELKHHFTIMLCILDKSPDSQNLKKDRIIWAAGKRQGELLKNYPNKGGLFSKLESEWERTGDLEFLSKRGYTLTSKLLKDYKDNKLKVGKLYDSQSSDYFTRYKGSKFYKNKDKRYEEELKNISKSQELEATLLRPYFGNDDKNHRYVSIPLIQYGEMDGVAHIIYERNVGNLFLSAGMYRQLIKSFSAEYESLILDWDLTDKNLYKDSVVDIAGLLEKPSILDKNALLKQLNYRKYYEDAQYYIEKRIEQNNAVVQKLLRENRKNAIASILIDSFAHNIGAHSLTSQSWWFKERAEYQKTGLKKNSHIPLIYSNFKIEEELHKEFKFLQEKAAFWNGITRDFSFGGQIMNLYDILCKDFINNPLYLGSLASTEGITRLNIRITIYENLKKKNKIEREKFVKKGIKNVLLNGIYVSIDLSKSNTSNQELSQYVEAGEYFEEFSEQLKEMRIFLPGGVVGKHSFYTILENEIRNVKHLPKPEIEKMKTEGLTLNLSFEETTNNPNEEKIRQEGKKELYKVGVWLHHPQPVDLDLMQERLEKLGGDIIQEENFYPKLGGLYQDKVCAAMLFNNVFSSVQDKETIRDQMYFPWIKAGFEPMTSVGKKTSILDYEISHRRLTNLEMKAETKAFLDEKFYSVEEKGKQYSSKVIGYFKKYFHLWKGEDIYKFNPENIKKFKNGLENISRFKFVNIESNEDSVSVPEIVNAGVGRIIKTKSKKIEEIYHEWIRRWNIQDIKTLKIKINDQNIATLVNLSKTIEFKNQQAIQLLGSQTSNRRRKIDHNTVAEVSFQHGESWGNYNVCNYKNQGSLIQYFMSGRQIYEAELSSIKAAELYETLTTRICIVDNRISERVASLSNLQAIENQLNLQFYNEIEEDWNKLVIPQIKDFNFLVIHLSFIEALNGKKYRERNMTEFIDEMILPNLGANNKPKKNFILIITTGRARTHWWEKLKANKPDYVQFTTFRPVSTLLSAVENGVSLKDDFEIKYGLVKALLGS